MSKSFNSRLIRDLHIYHFKKKITASSFLQTKAGQKVFALRV